MPSSGCSYPKNRGGPDQQTQRSTPRVDSAKQFVARPQQPQDFADHHNIGIAEQLR